MTNMNIEKIEGDTPRERLKTVVESETFQRFIIGVILLNAITIGLETSASAMNAFGPLLHALDILALAVFCIEIAVKLYVYRSKFWHDPWNVFDFVVVGIALVPAAEGASVLRALRILRALRLISVVPQMRLVVHALFRAIPAMGAVIALLTLVMYVSAVMATKLFGAHFEEWFGTIGASLYTLFQIMTLEGWSDGIVRPVMKVYPYAWAFFVPFIIFVAFAVMNLFIAIIVKSMTHVGHAEAESLHAEAEQLHEENVALEANQGEILTEIRALRREVAELRGTMGQPTPPS